MYLLVEETPLATPLPLDPSTAHKNCLGLDWLREGPPPCFICSTRARSLGRTLLYLNKGGYYSGERIHCYACEYVNHGLPTASKGALMKALPLNHVKASSSPSAGWGRAQGLVLAQPHDGQRVVVAVSQAVYSSAGRNRLASWRETASP